MFFLLRSAFCIALVVSCLPKVNDYSTSLTAASTVGAAEQWISASLGRACTSAAAQCAGLMAQSVLPVVRKASRNTLVASDLEPAWTGPAGKTTN